MSSKISATLADRRNDLTRQLILDAALGMIERASVGELTVRAVAGHANISERTIFRYFPSREAFLDAIADEVRKKLELPPPPRSIEEIATAPRALYRAFEANLNLVKATLHSELFSRMRESQARTRWQAVGRLIDELAPKRSARDRKIAAANIRYYLSATTWHYYRFYFGFDLEDSIACAEMAICQTIEAIGRRA
jgi:AcrR family transcriptional regulator